MWSQPSPYGEIGHHTISALAVGCFIVDKLQYDLNIFYGSVVHDSFIRVKLTVVSFIHITLP